MAKAFDSINVTLEQVFGWRHKSAESWWGSSSPYARRDLSIYSLGRSKKHRVCCAQLNIEFHNLCCSFSFSPLYFLSFSYSFSSVFILGNKHLLNIWICKCKDHTQVIWRRGAVGYLKHTCTGNNHKAVGNWGKFRDHRTMAEASNMAGTVLNHSAKIWASTIFFHWIPVEIELFVVLSQVTMCRTNLWKCRL
jgi:hypothetical protein